MMSTLDKKLAIFDLDGTLHINDASIETPILAKDTIAILEYLNSKNIKIALSSYNWQAVKILKKYDIYKYFDPNLCFEGEPLKVTSKIPHIASILALSKIRADETVFYDDDRTNIIEVHSMGVKSIRVDWRVGVTLDVVKNEF